jgi:hypothetical protein
MNFALFNCDYFDILENLFSVWIYGMNKLIDVINLSALRNGSI